MLMEFWVFLAFALLVFCGSAIGGFVFQVLFSGSIQARICSLENSIKGSAGRVVSKEKSERMIEAAMRAAALHKDGKNVQEILKTVASEYPDVALDFAKKAMQGKLGGGLEGLF